MAISAYFYLNIYLVYQTLSTPGRSPSPTPLSTIDTRVGGSAVERTRRTDAKVVSTTVTWKRRLAKRLPHPPVVKSPGSPDISPEIIRQCKTPLTFTLQRKCR